MSWPWVALAAVLVAPAARGQSDVARSSGAVLSGVLGAARFRQGDQGPPLCCAEREDWSVWGAELALGVGYRALDWFEPGVELSIGRLGGTDASRVDRTLDISLTSLGAAPRLGFRFGDPFFVAPRLSWQLQHVSGRFEGTEGGRDFQTSKSALFMGPGVGLGVGYRVDERWALGADAEFALISGAADLSNTLRLGGGVTWTP